MKPEELARKNCDTTINLNSCCDMSHCMGRVQIVLIVEQEEWQLCTACYEKYLTAIDNPRTRDAAEHCVELSQSGPTVSEDITYVGRACECSLAEKVYYLPFCADCGGALPRPAIVLSD